MDQAEPKQPSARRPQREAPRTAPRPVSHAQEADLVARLDHPIIVGFSGSPSSRNAMAYAAGVARRMGRPLLVVYVCNSGVYCEPLTGQIVGVQRDTEALERWLLAELDQITGGTDMDVHVRTRRGNPARELAGAAAEFCADALVIGGPSHVWRRIAGSVPSWLARHARCPVIVVP